MNPAMKSKTVLFVCSGNICRSPMAEGFLKKKLRERQKNTPYINVSSAGLYAFESHITGESIRVMKSEGVDLSNFRSKQLTLNIIKESDLILTMTRRHKYDILALHREAEDKVFTLKEFSEDTKQTNIEDPYGRGIEVYKACAQEIKNSITKSLDKIIEF